MPSDQICDNHVYGWFLGGLPLGLHRRTAHNVSWKLFPTLNLYGVALLALGEIAFKDNEGDPTIHPLVFRRSSIVAMDLVGALFMGITAHKIRTWNDHSICK